MSFSIYTSERVHELISHNGTHIVRCTVVYVITCKNTREKIEIYNRKVHYHLILAV